MLRTGRRWRVGTSVWTAAGLALLIVVILATLWVRPWSTRYRRFVSKPLSDGSRYTFLYPAHLRDIQENGAGASPEVTQCVTVYTSNQSQTDWDRLLRHLGIPILSPAESISVVVIPLKPRRVRDRRWSERWARGGGLRDNEFLVDARTKTQFVLMHSCPSDSAAQFEQNNPVITRSFQVLPPSASPSSQ
jgi:hypothetical protein